MSFIFVSHASEDKLDRVRPIVEVLLAEGEPVWLDRPGEGTGNFGFSAEFIKTNQIDFIGSGEPWSDSITTALIASGAVLGCLSRSLKGQRNVIINELTIAKANNKLVTCIVDDLSYTEVSELDIGLLEAGRLQAPKIDCTKLKGALAQVKQSGCAVEQLDNGLRVEWEKVRMLILSIDRMRVAPRPLRRADILRISPMIERCPIGPPIVLQDIPEEIVFALGDNVNKASRVHELLEQARQLIAHACAREKHLDKLFVREGALPPAGMTSGDNYWSQVLAHAGRRSRKSVASLIANPIAQWAFKRAKVEDIVTHFINRELV